MSSHGLSRAQKIRITTAALFFILIPYTYWLFGSHTIVGPVHLSTNPPHFPSQPHSPSPPSTPAPNNVLILYAYHETPFARPNAEFFIRHGLHSRADFIFILNGPTDIDALLPAAPNIRVWRRDNKCYDLGAYGEVLSANANELVGRYKRFILMNSSIRGPFMPYWSRECWSDAYLGKLSDRVKLVGMTYNCLPRRHIQSMLLATDTLGLSLLLSPKSLLTCHTYASAMEAEIHSTALITDAGYNVDVMMSAFHKDKDYARTCEHADVLFEGRYWGGDVSVWELLFWKTNRGYGMAEVERVGGWMAEGKWGGGGCGSLLLSPQFDISKNSSAEP